MHDTEHQLTLRQLARDYAEGRIDHSTYRTQRSQMLDQLADASKRYLKPAIVEQARSHSSTSSASSSNRLLLSVLFITLLLLGAVGFLLLSG